MLRSVVILMIVAAFTASAAAEEHPDRDRAKCIASSLKATRDIGIAITTKSASSAAKAAASTFTAAKDCPMVGPSLPDTHRGFSGAGASGSWGGGGNSGGSSSGSSSGSGGGNSSSNNSGGGNGMPRK